MQISENFRQLTDAQVWEHGTVELVCQRVIKETSDVSSFVFQTVPARRFSYKPGQFVTLQAEIDGELTYRSYTISSSPSRPYTLDLTIKRVEGGKMSGWLLDNLKEGDAIKAMGPDGGFNIVDLPAKHLLFLSASCGITPMMSMSRWLLDTNADVDIHFVHCGATAEDLLFVPELVAMTNTHPNFKVEFVVEDKEGFLNQERLNRVVSDLHQRHAYSCGSPNFMAAVEDMLEASGFDMANYHFEKFTADLVAGEADSETGAEQAGGEQFQVSLEKSGKAVTVDPADLVLDTLLGQQAPVIGACRQGVCGACKVKVIEGEVHSTSQMTLTPQEIEQGYVLSCCSRPKSDLRIDI
ncbi:MAG: hybrid-cluster NAD(P)-dependent oxidoreductase [Desulfovibrionales bacterium]|nr:hybrid-cluster NAD(P)-dependent oxidoreductase [Desulfovibrionales bacterium]